MTSGSQRGHRDGHGAAGAEHADQLLDRVDVGVDVLEHLCRNDPVELAVGEGQLQRVALLDVGLGTVRHLAGLLHRAEQLQHTRQLVGVHVEGNDVAAAAIDLVRVPPRATTHVEDPFTGA